MTTSQVRDTGWFKCTRSAGAGEDCVEVRITNVLVGVRDSKDQAGQSFMVPTVAWSRFVVAVKDDRIE